MTSSFRRLVIGAMLASLLGAPSGAVTQKRVLILWGGRVDLPANSTVNQVIRSRLYREFGADVDVRFEYVETSPDPQLALRDFLRRKYVQHRFDLILPIAEAATTFVRQHGRELFPGVPVVCWGRDKILKNWGSGPPATGAMAIDDPAAIVTFILRLQPDTRGLVVVAGQSQYDDRQQEANVRRALEPFRKRLRITYLSGPFEEVRRAAAQLPDRTAIFWVGMHGDQAGRRLVNVDALSMVAASARVPVYGPSRSLLGSGIVGGVLHDQEVMAADAAALAVRILRGARVEDVPVTYSRPVPMVDWRQLRRWNIPESRLPPGTVVLHKEPSLWETHKGRIVGVAALCTGQAALIVALLVHRARRRRAEELRSAVLASLNDHVAIVDAAGTLIEVNESWRRFVRENGPEVLGHALPPANYLATCRDTEDRHDGFGRPVRAALEAVLNGSGRRFQIEYSCPTAAGARWFALSVEPLRRPEGGAVVTHTDVTSRRESELAAQEQRRALAHLGRVAVLGELSGAMAHELNQPLTAILSNAETAQRMLRGPRPDLDELRDILDDIVAADERASQVIRRLRAMLRRNEIHMQALDMNELARDVLDLARADLLARGVTAATQLQEGLPLVAGDRVQLQQVLLNLVLNGCDAMAASPSAERELTVASVGDSHGRVLVRVQDRGSGIAGGDFDRIFQPFFTSKPEGLGLGLSICRTIVAAHGGHLWATNNDSARGATLHLALPGVCGPAAGAPPLSG